MPSQRDNEIARRSERTRAAAATAPAIPLHEGVYRTAGQARGAASKCGLPNTEVGAVFTPSGWVGVVYLRKDQVWMSTRVRAGGCRVDFL